MSMPPYSILSRIVKATQVDTVIHTVPGGRPHAHVEARHARGERDRHDEPLAAASSADSTVRNVMVKSSTVVYGCAPEDPVWFTEDTLRPDRRAARGAERRGGGGLRAGLRDRQPARERLAAAVLERDRRRDPDTLTRALRLPAVPSLFGFDPRFQFVHEDDVVRAMIFALANRLPGVYNVAGDGLLPWSEVAAICGKRTAPLPPIGTGLFTTAALRGNRPARGVPEPAALRPRCGQPAPQGRRVRVRAHLRPGRACLRGALAAARHPRRCRVVPLRTRCGTVLQALRRGRQPPPGDRTTGRPTLRATGLPRWLSLPERTPRPRAPAVRPSPPRRPSGSNWRTASWPCRPAAAEGALVAEQPQAGIRKRLIVRDEGAHHRRARFLTAHRGGDHGQVVRHCLQHLEPRRHRGVSGTTETSVMARCGERSTTSPTSSTFPVGLGHPQRLHATPHNPQARWEGAAPVAGSSRANHTTAPVLGS